MAIGSDKFARNIGLAVLAVVVLLGIFWFARTRINRAEPESTPVNKIENFEAGKKPNQFPDIPMQPGYRLVSNFNATSPEGKVQATQVFESSKSVSSNFTFYKNYLIKNKWTIMTEDSSKSDLQTIIAKNSTGMLTITIHASQDQTKSVVDISFLAN